jgi:WD40 repeat protein/energy-coupling factor transporter ATP-binding protein EcfA2/Na+-transporting methylmalonyl-CoA/oxaloacetate decarboxylase gamma subunit
MSKGLTVTADESIRKVKKYNLNPFPGLRPFGVDESHLFFGREGQSDDVLVKLTNHKFVAIIGPSGSGKSSFMYCGVVPKLYGGFVADKSSEWKVIVTRVGVDPLDNLANALLEIDENYLGETAENQRIRKIITTTLLQTQSTGLTECIEQYQNHASDCNYFVIVDQFEELFRYKQLDPSGGTNDKALAFVNLLTEAVANPNNNIYIALAMRSDFIGECSQYPELTRLINESNYLIPQMTREQKRMAILGPVAVGGATISPKLVQRLLNELGDNPDQLPVLAHSLMRTWDYWQQFREYDSEPIDSKHYEAIGRMEEALSLHADEAYNELSEMQKEICESMFKSLVGKSSTNAGIRRPTRLEEIAQIANCSIPEVKAVVEKFREPGRALVTPPIPTELNNDSVIDFSHESLMRIWVRLKSWVVEENESIQMYLRLAEAAEMYQVGKAGLWRPPDLQLALNWYLKEKPTLVWAQRYHPAFERTIAFLEHSSEKYETEQQVKEMLAKRALRRSQTTAVVLGAAMVVSLLFLVYAIFQQLEAQTQAELAKASEKKAIAAKEDADRNAEEAKRNAEKARINAAIAQKKSVEAEEARVEAEKARDEAFRQRNNAETQKKIAQENLTLAEERKIEAEKQTVIAQNNEKEANIQKNRADVLKMRNIARAMSNKSIRMNDNLDLKALVAQQSYLFNKEYGDNPDDPDVYEALYTAIRDLSGGKSFNQLNGHDDNEVLALVVSPFKNTFFSSGDDGRIFNWNGADFSQTPSLIAKNEFLPRALAVSPDEKILANAGESNIIQFFDLANGGKKVNSIKVSTNEVWFLNFTADSKTLIFGDSTTLHSSNMNSVKEIARFDVKNLCASLHPKRNVIALGNKAGETILYNLDNNTKIVLDDNRKVAIRSVEFSHSGKILATGDIKGVVRIWDVETRKLLHILPGHTAFVNDICFNKDDSQMATASFDRKVLLWNTDRFNEQQPIILTDHYDWIFSVVFTNDSKHLIVGGREHEMRFYPTRNDAMSNILCGKIQRNMSLREWQQFVDKDVPYQKTCTNLDK